MKGREMRIRQEVLVSWLHPVRELFCSAKGAVLGTQCQCWMTGCEECSQADLLRSNHIPWSLCSRVCGIPSLLAHTAHCVEIPQSLGLCSVFPFQSHRSWEMEG